MTGIGKTEKRRARQQSQGYYGLGYGIMQTIFFAVGYIWLHEDRGSIKIGSLFVIVLCLLVLAYIS